MNYEQLLDEIMVNTLSAKELIGTPQRDFQYAVCPWDLEFHTMIFLSSILLTFDAGTGDALYRRNWSALWKATKRR